MTYGCVPICIFRPSTRVPTVKSRYRKVWRFLTSEDGPTAVEYAVMLALIVLVCLTAISTIGKNANQVFQKVASSIHT